MAPRAKANQDAATATGTGTGTGTDKIDRITDDQTSTDRGTGTGTGTGTDQATGDQSAAATENDTFVQPTITVKPPRKPRKDKGQAKVQTQRKPAEGGLTTDQVALTMCASLSAIAVAVTQREEAAMQPAEMALIQPALVSTLSGMSERAKEKVSQYSGPVMLAAGLGLWELRLAKIKPVQPAKQQPQQQQPRAPIPQERRNGREDDPGYPSESILAVLGGGLSA